VRRLREDVHIHAPATEVYNRLLSLHRDREWLPPAFSELEASAGELAFALTLPMRTERSRLVVSSDEPPTFVEFAAVNGAGGIELLNWALSSEGPREVHLTVEAGYEPSRGLLGWLLEETVHRPARRQAFRDALWRLKLLSEGRR
jgi:polyketide cyclase/dehydrase/lipid transport protein